MKHIFKKFIVLPIILSAVMISASAFVNMIKSTIGHKSNVSKSDEQSNNILDSILSSFNDEVFAEADQYGGGCATVSRYPWGGDICGPNWDPQWIWGRVGGGSYTARNVCMTEGDVISENAYTYGISPVSSGVYYNSNYVSLSSESPTYPFFNYQVTAKYITRAQQEELAINTSGVGDPLVKTQYFIPWHNQYGESINAEFNTFLNVKLEHPNQPPIQDYTSSTTTSDALQDINVSVVYDDEEQSPMNITFYLYNEDMTTVLQSYTYNNLSSFNTSGALPQLTQGHTFSGLTQGRYRWKTVATESNVSSLCVGTTEEKWDNQWTTTSTISTLEVATPSNPETMTPSPTVGPTNVFTDQGTPFPTMTLAPDTCYIHQLNSPLRTMIYDGTNIIKNVTTYECEPQNPDGCNTLYPLLTTEFNGTTNTCDPITCTFNSKTYNIDNINIGKNFEDGSCAPLRPQGCDLFYPRGTVIYSGGSCIPNPSPTAACSNTTGSNYVQNYNFENGLTSWSISDELNAPTISSAKTFDGDKSLLLGDLGSLSGNGPNGYSSVYQTVAVPSGNSKLSFNYWPYSEDSINNDWQEVYISDINGKILQILMHANENDQTWKSSSFDLSAYAGQTIRVNFAVYQDSSLSTGMYVDNVHIEGCEVIVPTNTPIPSMCQNPGSDQFQNGGFETGDFTNYSTGNTGTASAPMVSSSQVASGTYSALLGNMINEFMGDSYIYQEIAVPANGAYLSYSYWPTTFGYSITQNWQDVIITDTNDQVLATVMHVLESDQTWKNVVNYNLSTWAGQTIRIKFLVHQYGSGWSNTAMYVDNIIVEGCPSGSPANTPSPANTSSPTSTLDPLQPDTVYMNSHGFNYSAPKQVVYAHRPRFIGTDPNVSYVIVHSEPITVPVTTDGSGNWSFVIDTPLAQGDHTVTTYDVNNNPLGANNFTVKSTISLLVVNMSNTNTSSTNVNATLTWTSAHEYLPGDTLTIVIPSEATAGTNYFGQSSTYTTGDITIPTGFSLTSSTIGSFTLTATGTTPEATDISIILGGGKLTNPTNSGNYAFSFYSTQVMSVTADTSAGIAYIGDTNKAHITTRVIPTLSFNITDVNDNPQGSFPVVCDFGTLDTRYINTCKYRLKVSTNSENGFSVSYTSSSGGLTNGTYIFAPAPSSVTQLTAGQEYTGANIQPGSVTGANQGTDSATSTISCNSNCDTSGASFDSTTPTAVYESTTGNAPSNVDTTNTALVTHVASPSSTTPAGTYKQTIIYNIVGRF
ncbi:MAG: choice-of-anchor J domain-containing protein [bacterium]